MKPFKVSEVNNYIKKIISGDIILSNIEIEGEVSNYKKHYSGHLYFSLKDEKGRIKCIMFKGDAEYNGVGLVEGQKVVAKGYISVYEKGGEYQLYVRDIINRGIGQLYKKFEDLKVKLKNEGLFDEENKKPIPSIPNKIGIVTSATGAAIEDIITIVKRRFPKCELIIYPSLVQGDNAPGEIIKALLYLDGRKDIDLIIFGRGGGSIEELFAFNDESLARTIFQLETPNISAVGHETDFTIADFVADLRAPTPSAAAEIAVPDIENLLISLEEKYIRIINFWDYYIMDKTRELRYNSNALRYNSPLYKIKENAQNIDNLFENISFKFKNLINENFTELRNLEKNLHILNPQLSLEKGNAIITDDEGHILRSVHDFRENKDIRITMKDGTILANVLKINEGGTI